MQNAMSALCHKGSSFDGSARGRELSYIEGWFAISGADRIFGFDGWSCEPVNSRFVLARENRGSFLAIYVAKFTDQRCRERA